MSLKSDVKNRIKQYMMEKIFFSGKDFIKRTMDAFSVSDTTVYSLLKKLIAEGKVRKLANGEYKLCSFVDKTFRYTTEGDELSEDVIYSKSIKKYIDTLPDNVSRIWEYAFAEIMNNAIDHSDAKTIRVRIEQNAAYTCISISDDGIGIFERIAGYFRYPELSDAVLSLFKGKLTTKSETHSGEGIFFTSKAVDHFAARSSGLVFEQNNTEEKVYPGESSRKTKGTVIYMALSNCSSRNLKDVFDQYANIEEGFVMTRVPISYVSDSGFPVSRSQAKRLCFGLDNFEKAILDFSGVDEIGQGFADEVFRVFAKAHPSLCIEYENASPEVDKMIRHVTHSLGNKN